jgi:hypothetical protein
LARFHTQPISRSQRRILSAEMLIPHLASRVRANVAQLQLVRHQWTDLGNAQATG